RWTPSGSAGAKLRRSWRICPPDASAPSAGVSAGETTVTAAFAARRPCTLRSATSPPPTTRQRRPASSRKTGKKPISAVHPVRRAAGRDVALHHLNESAREPRAELLVGVAGAELPEVLPGEALGEERAEQPL